MARGNWNGGSDRDTDGRPGNSTESPSYARIYDTRSESELSFRPETNIQIRRALNQQQEAEDNARLAAQSRVHGFQGVGKFVVPPEQYKDTWAAHAELIKDQNQNLFFNPKKFPYFDKIIADKLDLPALTDPKHKDYAKYEGLRTNLAVLRNDLVGMYVQDGTFDEEDWVHVPKILAIAESIADGLKNDTWLRRPFAPSLSMDVANVEATGGREIYKYLLERQTKPVGALEALRSRFKELLGMTDLTWGLPPIENTPFSDAGLAAPPPPHRECFTAEELAAACAKDNNRLLDLSDSAVRMADDVRSLETLKAPTRPTSAQEARKIFRFLRNLQFGDENVEDWMGAGTPAEQFAKADALHRLIEIYAGELHKTTFARPESFYNVVIDNASEAAGGFALGMTAHVGNVLPQESAVVARIDEDLKAMPDIWYDRSRQSVTRLLDTLEAGLIHTMGADVSDKSAADRLLEFSAHIRDTAQKLRRAEDMDSPAREESIELAREILRRLKDIKFNDMPIEELTRGGTTAHNAELAQKFDEMADTYRTLLAQAAQTNPDIINNPSVLEANEAVGQFAHAASLMAAKETPGNLAASQQIAAEIAAMPGEWKNLDDKTIGRLAEKMEGGLEEAAHEIEAQEKLRGDEEISMDDAHSGRRKRRRGAASAQVAAAGMRKVDRDLKADDRAIADAAMRAPRSASPVANRPGAQLRAEDMAAVKAAVKSSLRSSNEQMNLAAVDVKPGDKIVPDDQGAAAFVDQMRDQRRGRPNGNRNNPNNNRPTRT
jgi:hypothetical protein